MKRSDTFVNTRFGDGRTPLYLAAYKGHHEIVSMLLARRDILAELPRNDGVPPVVAAMEQGHMNIVMMFQEYFLKTGRLVKNPKTGEIELNMSQYEKVMYKKKLEEDEKTRQEALRVQKAAQDLKKKKSNKLDKNSAEPRQNSLNKSESSSPSPTTNVTTPVPLSKPHSTNSLTDSTSQTKSNLNEAITNIKNTLRSALQGIKKGSIPESFIKVVDTLDSYQNPEEQLSALQNLLEQLQELNLQPDDLIDQTQVVNPKDPVSSPSENSGNHSSSKSEISRDSTHLEALKEIEKSLTLQYLPPQLPVRYIGLFVLAFLCFTFMIVFFDYRRISFQPDFSHDI